MNENYLWEKDGTDAEIERLENALKTFRYQEMPAPLIPAPIVTSKSKSGFSFFRLSFAFAATCAILTIAGVSVWSYVFDKNFNVSVDSAKVIEPNSPTIIQPTIEIPQIKTVETTQITSVKAIQLVQRSPKQKFTRARKNFPAVDSKSEKSGGEIAHTETIAQLRGEEKYAYDQLMLALSITSSKLNIVKEKLGVAENSSGISNGGK